MSQFLEEVKTRMEEAQKRLQAAMATLQQAQAQHNAAAQEFGSLQHLYQLEMRRSQGAVNPAVPQIASNPTAPAAPNSHTAENGKNKSEIVRQMLRDHPTGPTPRKLSFVFATLCC